MTRYIDAGDVLPFLCSAVAVTLLASLVGRSVEQLGDRFGPGATGAMQSALGNLPELFIALFALNAGQIALVLAPLLVILSQVFGFATLTLVFPPMLVVSVAIAVVIAAFITLDGESNRIEGRSP